MTAADTSPGDPSGVPARRAAQGPRRDAAAELLEQIVEVVHREAFSPDLSMRSIATELGVAHRLLAYHFGSWDGVLAAVLNALRSEEQEWLRVQAEPRRTREELCRMAWDRYLDPDQWPRVRTFFAVLGRALGDRERYAVFLESSRDWSTLLTKLGIEEGRDPRTAELEAHYLVAGMRGLLIDLQLSGDPEYARAGGELLFAGVFGRTLRTG